jgi:hypothetical protein
MPMALNHPHHFLRETIVMSLEGVPRNGPTQDMDVGTCNGFATTTTPAIRGANSDSELSEIRTLSTPSSASSCNRVGSGVVDSVGNSSSSTTATRGFRKSVALERRSSSTSGSHQPPRTKQQQQQQDHPPQQQHTAVTMSLLLQGELVTIPHDRQVITVRCAPGSQLQIVCTALLPMLSSAVSSGDSASALGSGPSTSARCRVTIASVRADGSHGSTQASFSKRGSTSYILGVGDVAVFGAPTDGADQYSIEVALWCPANALPSNTKTTMRNTELEQHLGTVAQDNESPAQAASHALQNRSERAFVTRAVAKLLAAADGAPALDDFLKSMQASRWLPPHAAELLASDPQINLFFESTSEPVPTCCCVARKKAKPKYHRRCPYVASTLDIRGALRRAAMGEPAWKQCGATFSTMMRYFQKTPEAFEWKTDNEKRTVIKHRAF